MNWVKYKNNSNLLLHGDEVRKRHRQRQLNRKQDQPEKDTKDYD